MVPKRKALGMSEIADKRAKEKIEEIVETKIEALDDEEEIINLPNADQGKV
jgi:hypothetical protein